MNRTIDRVAVQHLMADNHSTRSFSETFTLIRPFSSGNTCEVWEAVRNKDGRRFAVKRLRKSGKWSQLLFESEATILNHLDHPGIVSLESVYEDDEFFFIVTKLGKSDLFGAVTEEGKMSEDRARSVIRKILETLTYLHGMDIAHRDIKPENVIFSESDVNQPQLIDFADAIRVDKDKQYTEFVGTTCYMAPERLRDHTGYELKLSDVWAVGVLAYEMVTAKRCFYGNNDIHLLRKIQQGAWAWPRNQASVLSVEFKDFIEHLLELHPRKRYSAEQALMHPWLNPSRDGASSHSSWLQLGDEKEIQSSIFFPSSFMSWMTEVVEDDSGKA